MGGIDVPFLFCFFPVRIYGIWLRRKHLVNSCAAVSRNGRTFLDCPGLNQEDGSVVSDAEGKFGSRGELAQPFVLLIFR